MTRKEVKHYIQLSLRIYKKQEMNIDEMVDNIINAVSESWFFSWNSFMLGYLAGAVVYLIFMNIKL